MGTQAAPSESPPAPRAHRAIRALLPLLAAMLLLGGCASGGGPEAQPEITVPLRLHAGDNLNAGGDGPGVATVVRIYHLRGMARFEQAPFDVLMDETREQAALGSDLVQAREVVLTPGMQREFEERVSPDTTHIGVAALFREPASGRWRYAFDARQEGVAGEGITIGLHACAMTTSSTALSTRLPGDASSLASVRCQPAGR